MEFLQQPTGQAMREKLWKETLAELGKYTEIPQALAA